MDRKASQNPIDDQMVHAIDKDQMNEHLQVFCQLNRLTGEKEAEVAVDYIVKKLEEYGVNHDRYWFDSYFSDPIQGKVKVIQPENDEVAAKTRSFSFPCPDGIEAEVVYDEYSKQKSLSSIEEEKWFQTFRDKIVLSWECSEDYVTKIDQAGAKGLIHIWPTKEAVIHEDTVGTIWGTPTTENVYTLPRIPVVGISYDDGIKIIEQAVADQVKVVVTTKLNVGIKHVSLPVAYIPGETETYINRRWRFKQTDVFEC